MTSNALVNCNSDPVVIGDFSLNILLYADDIVLLSQSKKGLQNSLNALYDYCDCWKLQVNTDKSKVIVFNSNGKTFLDEFTYNDSCIETVSHYSYLGIVIKCNGNFNLAINTLMEKARKAYFKIKKTVGLNNPCRLLEKLFDTLISPILMYCSEIWGVNSSLRDSEPFEKLHIKFIKEALGVHCKASNDACRAELGRIPLKNKIVFSSINFLEHILSSENTLVNQIFCATRFSNPWILKTQCILQKLGYSYLVEKSCLTKQHLGQVKQRIYDQCLQNQNANIQESSKLSFFRQVYKMGQRPSYVDSLNNLNDRAAICKIRISAHPLMIERGRHLNIPREERYCPVCKNGEIEDEQHFLLKCNRYTSKREILENKINVIFQIQRNITVDEKISLLVNNSSALLLRLSSSFISECLNIRNSELI